MDPERIEAGGNSPSFRTQKQQALAALSLIFQGRTWETLTRLSGDLGAAFMTERLTVIEDLLCARYCSRRFTCIISFNPQWSYELGIRDSDEENRVQGP